MHMPDGQPSAIIIYPSEHKMIVFSSSGPALYHIQEDLTGWSFVRISHGMKVTLPFASLDDAQSHELAILANVLEKLATQPAV